MIGHVLDAGKDYRDPNHRGYQTRAALDYHCDQTDLVCLMCINKTKTGGVSKLVSSIQAYNGCCQTNANQSLNAMKVSLIMPHKVAATRQERRFFAV
jgi:hypothetical protein